jgi:hypothetical protein
VHSNPRLSHSRLLTLPGPFQPNTQALRGTPVHGSTGRSWPAFYALGRPRGGRGRRALTISSEIIKPSGSAGLGKGNNGEAGGGEAGGGDTAGSHPRNGASWPPPPEFRNGIAARPRNFMDEQPGPLDSDDFFDGFANSEDEAVDIFPFHDALPAVWREKRRKWWGWWLTLSRNTAVALFFLAVGGHTAGGAVHVEFLSDLS